MKTIVLRRMTATPLPLAAAIAVALGIVFMAAARAQVWVYLDEVPDYEWYAGCFGTASGNLMGFWDRHGLPDFYTGPTGGGLAPLDSIPPNRGIRSMWASKAGVDGRPLDQMGHIDDYVGQYTGENMDSYESTADDPYVLAGRPEHSADCVGDFIGLNQKKWTNLAGECDGNIDAYSFVFWDKTGQRRNNYSQTNATGQSIPDIQSGLRSWARYRGYDADVFTQLTVFNPEKTGAGGFTYADVKAEIDAGYPILCFLQPLNQFSRRLNDPVLMAKANPDIHGVMIYGYVDDPASGANESVLIRTSWGTAYDDPYFSIQPWASYSWLGLFPVRGVIGFHPKPKITQVTRQDGNVTVNWDGPSSTIVDVINSTTRPAHRYQVEASPTLDSPQFTPVGDPTTERTLVIPGCCSGSSMFYRVKLLAP